MTWRHLIGMLGLVCSCTVLAAADVGNKPPDKPPVPADKTPPPYCAVPKVNACRAACDERKFAAATKAELAQKQQACKQDCIRGC